ncbi:MAG: hypothetical protein ACRDYC_08280, partial [Acidimicrobiales bacterium]
MRTAGRAAESVGVTSVVPRLQRQALAEKPSVQAPGLSQSAFDAAQALLASGKWQEAVDVIVDECVRTGQIDR